MIVERESTVIALACGLVTELASVVAFARYFDRKVVEPGVGGTASVINIFCAEKVVCFLHLLHISKGAQWLNGRVLNFDLKSTCCWFKTYQRHCIVSFSRSLSSA